MSNITIDDTNWVLVYSSGWGVDSSSDPALNQYFLSTYHASQTPGADVNITFTGSAIYLYGSKGPNHGNFSVRYDSSVQLLSAREDTLEYQQLLFSASFPSGIHSLTVTNTDENLRWLDLDFVMVTEPANTSSTINAFSSTIAPPVLSSTTVDASPVPSSPQSSVTVSTRSTSNTPTLILAIVFGALFFCLCVGVSWYLLRRRSRRQEGRNQLSHHTYRTENPQSMRSAGSDRFIVSQPAHSPTSPFSQSRLLPGQTQHPASSVSSQYNGHGNMNFGSLSGQESDVAASSTHDYTSSPPVARPWSPFAAPFGRMFGAPKPGADSMKSTFLKV